MKKSYLSLSAAVATLALTGMASANPLTDSLMYRFKHLDTGQHPYIQDIFANQKVTRNKLDYLAERCLDTAPEANPVDPDIRVYVNYDRGWHTLRRAASCFTERTGVTVAIEISPEGEDMAQNYSDMAAAGNAPDLVLWAHDRIGDWAEKGYIQPMSPYYKVFNSVPIASWEAGKFNGEYYGLPLTMESSALIYNKAFYSEPPASFAELADFDFGDAQAFSYDYKNTYFSMGLIHADGGYAYQQTSSGWDPEDIGVNNDGAVAGLQTLVDLINDGVLDPTADYGSANDGFIAGNVGAVINGPWSWSQFENANIDFGVAPIPSVNGEPGKPFVGVLTYLLSADSSKSLVASHFAQKWLLSEQVIAAMDAEWSLGGVLNVSYVLNDDTNPLVLDALQIGQGGIQMPNIPQMSRFWDAMGDAISAATRGDKTVVEALDTAAESMAN